MHKHPAHPKELIRSTWENGDLIMTLAVREIRERYNGSLLGSCWPFLHPILMLGIYTFVFSKIFNMKWQAHGSSQIDFAMALFPNLIIFNLFAECISRAPSLIISKPNYVKKVVFPIEILPIVSLLNALFHFSISFTIWLVSYSFLYRHNHHALLLITPILMIPFAFFIVGLSWWISSLSVYLRDLAQIIGVIIPILMFISPIFYDTASIPDKYKVFIYINPIAPVIDALKNAANLNQIPSIAFISAYWAFSLLVALTGFAWFQKIRSGFADVI